MLSICLQKLCRTHQAGKMDIMSAGMHHAIVYTFIGQIALLRDGQRIQFRSQGHSRTAFPSPYDRSQ